MSKRWSYKVVEVKPQWLGIKPKQLEETLAALGHDVQITLRATPRDRAQGRIVVVDADVV